jgi:hypothetical protein
MAKEKDKKEQPIVSMKRERREDVWDLMFTYTGYVQVLKKTQPNRNT